MTEKLPTNGAAIDIFGHEIDFSGQKLMFSAIIQAVGSGALVDDACAAQGVPAFRFFRAVDKDEELRTAYACAQRARAELMAEQVVSIADDQTADPAHNRNKMQARQWLASKLYAAKFGDKLQVEIEQRVSLADALKEAQARVIPGSYQTIPESAQVIDMPALPIVRPTDSQSDSAPDDLADLLS